MHTTDEECAHQEGNTRDCRIHNSDNTLIRRQDVNGIPHSELAI